MSFSLDNLGGALGGFGSDLDFYTPKTTTGGGSIFSGLTDSVFGGQLASFGKDLFSGYLDLQGQKILISEQAKLAAAQNEQAKLLGTVEQPQNTNAQTFTPEQLAALSGAASSGGGGNNNLLLLAGLAGLVYLVVK